jgi:hypothetical protein
MGRAAVLTFLCLSLLLHEPSALRGIACAAGETSHPPAPPSSSPSLAPRRLALLVGVSRYYQRGARPGWDPWPVLHTDRELEEYRQVLIRDYGFAERDVKVLQDKQATREAIRSSFQSHLIAQARPGDVMLFHFSGHGQQLPDEEDPSRRDEPDGLDESLVPYDAVDQSVAEGAAKNIRDDELGQWLQELAGRMRPSAQAPRAGNITVTLDTCFSGTATRGALGSRGRSWDPTLDGPPPAPRPNLPAEGGAGILHRPGSGDGDLVVVSAARTDQTAWERDQQGVFTRHWVRLLARARGTTGPVSYRALVERLAIDLAAEGLEQTPQVEGAADRLLFSGQAHPNPRPHDALRAHTRSDGSMWLEQGEVHGVTQGSRYRLYPIETARFDKEAQLGEADVAEAAPFAARLELRPPHALSNGSGLLAVEVHHAYSFAPLRVILRGFTVVPALRSGLRRLDVLQVVGEEGDVNRTDHDLVLDYRAATRSVAIARPTARAPDRVLPLRDGELAPLAKQLQAEWRRQHFSGLRRETPQAQVDLELLPVDAKLNAEGGLIGEPWRLPAPRPSAHLRLAKGKLIGLRLSNRSSSALYVAVLAISPDGDINVLFGTEPGENRLRAGQTSEPPLRSTVHRLVGAPGQRVVIKVIATDSFVDFSGVESASQPTSTRAAPPPRSALYEPLQRLLEGLGEGPSRGPTLVQPSRWGTTDASVTIE